jgi:hypothetical protein
MMTIDEMSDLLRARTNARSEGNFPHGDALKERVISAIAPYRIHIADYRTSTTAHGWIPSHGWFIINV